MPHLLFKVSFAEYVQAAAQQVNWHSLLAAQEQLHYAANYTRLLLLTV